jgi:hypothetical protein
MDPHDAMDIDSIIEDQDPNVPSTLPLVDHTRSVFAQLDAIYATPVGITDDDEDGPYFAYEA